jgi:protein-tyrosine phosphatase
MKEKIKISIPIFLAAAVLCCCAKRKASISALCEVDARNNYVLKWEIYPEPSNTASMDIYTSNNDSLFPASAAKTVKADDYIAVIERPLMGKRMFFRIKTDNATSGIIANRLFDLDSIHNFRDMGGYYNNEGRQIRWGKVYRSGTLTRMSEKDKLELDKLDIKTILDIRSSDSQRSFPEDFIKTKNYVRLPIGNSGFEYISPKIMENRFLRGDAIIFTQDNYRAYIENYTEQYARFFDYLTDESNYPIVFNCYLGKDQSGIAAYLLLRVLDVPTETAEEDYMLSNIGVNRSLFTRWADDFSESKLEVISMMSNTDLAYLRYGLSCIRKKYGSIDDYMQNELKITPEKRKKLQDILLSKAVLN